MKNRHYVKYAHVGETCPVSVYNADEAKLIGIFSSHKLAAEFIYGRENYRNKKGSGDWLATYIRNNTRVNPKSSQHNFKIAIRNSYPKHIEELGNLPFIIKDEILLKFKPVQKYQ